MKVNLYDYSCKPVFEQLKCVCKDELHTVLIRIVAIMYGVISMDEYVQVKEEPAIGLNRQAKNRNEYVVPILLALGLIIILLSLL